MPPLSDLTPAIVSAGGGRPANHLARTGSSPVGARFPRWQLIGLLVLVLGLFCTGAPAAAAADPLGQAGTVGVTQPTLVERFSFWVLQTQRDLHRTLTRTLHRLDDAPAARTAGALILASFLYGVFHAAGPGHGKAVITTYLLTHRQSLRRGLLLSLAAALLQGVTAILGVLILIGLLGFLAREAMGQVRTLELASFLLVALLGLWLVLRGLRSLWRIHRDTRGNAAGTQNAATEPAAASATQTAVFQRVGIERPQPLAPLVRNPRRTMQAARSGDCGCGTPHHVDPNLRGPWYATVIAVGIRPCSGAVLVMAVSYLLGLWLAGVAAVLAMSLGTALTVSALALLAVSARDLAQRLARPAGVRGLRYAGALAGIAGGLVIFLIGGILVQGSLAMTPAPHPLGL